MWRVILFSVVLAGTASADDPFACVDPDVASAFVGHLYGAEGSVSTKIPSDFVELNIPTGLELIGSQSFDSHTTVVFKSDLPAQQALRTTVAAMEDVGWSDETNRQQRATGGFQVASQPSHAMICHNEDQESLAVMSIERSHKTFVSIVQYPQKLGCGTSNNSLGTIDHGAIRAYMPTMHMPDDAEVSNMGGGGNGYEMNSRVDVSSALGRTELTNFFEDQIREQGWESQTSWSSMHSAGSVWARTTEEHGLIIGTLHLMGPESGPARVRFDVAPATAGVGGSNWSLVSSTS